MKEDLITARLKEYINAKGWTAKDFERHTGLGNGTAARICSSTRKTTYDRIADSGIDLNLEWLLTGEGEMCVQQAEPKISYTEGVPYYDEDFMLGFEEIGTPNSENPSFLIRMPGYERATLWCNASGHSMEPEINSGDIIALQRIEDISFLPFGDVYGIITKNGMRTIKRLGRSSREGYYRLIPTNKDYDEQEIPISIISHVYRVMGTMKSF